MLKRLNLRSDSKLQINGAETPYELGHSKPVASASALFSSFTPFVPCVHANAAASLKEPSRRREGFFWPAFPMFGWGIGIVFHAWDVFWPQPSETAVQDAMNRIARRK